MLELTDGNWRDIDEVSAVNLANSLGCSTERLFANRYFYTVTNSVSNGLLFVVIRFVYLAQDSGYGVWQYYCNTKCWE